MENTKPKKWITTEVTEDNTLIIWVKSASRYDTTYYPTEKQISLYYRLKKEKSIIYEGSNNSWRNYIRKYNMSEIIDFLINFNEREKYEKVIIKIN